MLNQRLRALFKSYEPALQKVIMEVMEVEQRHISRQRPRGIYEEIDKILTRIAQQELKKAEGEGSEA